MFELQGVKKKYLLENLCKFCSAFETNNIKEGLTKFKFFFIKVDYFNKNRFFIF